MPIDEARVFNVLFQGRHDSDYGDFVVVNPEDAYIWMAQTEHLLEVIAHLLNAGPEPER